MTAAVTAAVTATAAAAVTAAAAATTTSSSPICRTGSVRAQPAPMWTMRRDRRRPSPRSPLLSAPWRRPGRRKFTEAAEAAAAAAAEAVVAAVAAVAHTTLEPRWERARRRSRSFTFRQRR